MIQHLYTNSVIQNMSQANLDVLYIQLKEAQSDVDYLTEQINIEKLKIQQQCKHEKFRTEDDGDYHRWTYYYVCEACGYETKNKPK